MQSSQRITMETVLISTEALKELIKTAVAELLQSHPQMEQKWIDTDEALARLHVGKTTLYHLRASGTIEYTQPHKKIILYCAESIENFLETHRRHSF